MAGKNRTKPARTQVSLKGETYKMLKKEAERRGCRITELTEAILNGTAAPPSALNNGRG